MPEAFTKSLQKKLPIGVHAHDWNNPVATTIAVEQLQAGDSRLPDDIKEFGGLYIKGQFFEEIPSSWETYLKIKNGLFREFSIGYNVIRDGFKDGIRELYELELHEWSPVLVGANPATSLLAVKDSDFNSRIERLAQEVQAVVGHTNTRKELRTKAGRVFSARNEEVLLTLADVMETGGKDLRRIVSEASKPKSAPETESNKAKLHLATMILNGFDL